MRTDCEARYKMSGTSGGTQTGGGQQGGGLCPKSTDEACSPPCPDGKNCAMGFQCVPNGTCNTGNTSGGGQIGKGGWQGADENMSCSKKCAAEHAGNQKMMNSCMNSCGSSMGGDYQGSYKGNYNDQGGMKGKYDENRSAFFQGGESKAAKPVSMPSTLKSLMPADSIAETDAELEKAASSIKKAVDSILKKLKRQIGKWPALEKKLQKGATPTVLSRVQKFGGDLESALQQAEIIFEAAEPYAELHASIDAAVTDLNAGMSDGYTVIDLAVQALEGEGEDEEEADEEAHAAPSAGGAAGGAENVGTNAPATDSASPNQNAATPAVSLEEYMKATLETVDEKEYNSLQLMWDFLRTQPNYTGKNYMTNGTALKKFRTAEQAIEDNTINASKERVGVVVRSIPDQLDPKSLEFLKNVLLLDMYKLAHP